MRRRLPIAVVIPAYDAETLIAGAVATVRAQSVDVEEIVVVDDGSRDDTARAAAAAGARVIRQANAGCGPARNTGVLATSAPWIALLDADDRWDTGKLAAQWDALALEPATGLIGTNCSVVRNGATIVPDGFAAHAAYASVPRIRLAPGIIWFSRHALARGLAFGQFIQPSSLLVRRDVLEHTPFAADLVSTRTYHLPEDLEWYLRVARTTDAIVLERPLLQYTIGGQSLSADLGRMQYGVVKLGDRIGRDRTRYADGTAAIFASLRAKRRRGAAITYLRAIEVDQAGQLARDALSEAFRLDMAVVLVVARFLEFGPLRWIAASLRRLWRNRRSRR